MGVDTLIMENFRCFAGRHEVPLKPLTVLVGENSSGKSSFLAAVRLSADVLAGKGLLNFKEPPFDLGSWQHIANNRGGKADRVVLGRQSARQIPVTAEATFAEESSQPRAVQRSLRLDGTPITLTPAADGSTLLWVDELFVDHPGQSSEPFEIVNWSDALFILNRLTVWFDEERTRTLTVNADGSRLRSLLTDLSSFVQGRRGSRPYAFAPMRARPERSYDPKQEIPDAEGGHIPMVLARILSQESPEARGLSAQLTEFGEASGLFSKVSVRRPGGGADPFHIEIHVSARARNLIDVGYGVSQVLPVLVEMLTSPGGRTFLIQQPEVHLHPRAQAALASLFARLAKVRDIQIIVETHSDHFIDRVRMDVRDGKALAPDEVSLLYFELQKGASKIYPIRFDELGNVLGAPPSYRRFFLDEDMRFFGAK